jgi:O-antigen/teichoic acid export membrane protein
MQAVEQPTSDQRRGERFVVNLLWNWMGVAAGLFTGLLLSPYLIKKLGPEAYGIWALSFALVEYYGFLDLGFRSATVKYVAHYWALDEPVAMSQIVNTALVYAGLISAGIFTVIFVSSGYLHYFFKVPPEYLHSFRILILLISLSWCLGFVLGIFGAGLEAIQRFDLYSKANVTATVLRASGTAVLLYFGYGLIAIGVLVVFTQCLGYLLFYIFFRRTAPAYEPSLRHASLATLRKMGSFGIHTFLINVSNLFLNQSPPMLIGHFFATAFVGYFQLPMRLIQYTAEAVGRIGIITNANAAELQARGDSRILSKLAIYANRYSLTLFMPLALALWVYPDRLFVLWAPSMASHSAPLLPVLLTGYMIAVVAEFSSGMLLQGLGRHQWIARGTLAEAIAVVALLIFALPRYGIMGAAWITAGCMVLNRGLFAPWLVSREMKFSFAGFLNSIYTRPVLSAIPAALLACTLRFTILPGRSWLQLFAAGAMVATVYFAVAFFLCLPAEHRSRVRGLVMDRLPLRRLRPA